MNLVAQGRMIVINQLKRSSRVQTQMMMYQQSNHALLLKIGQGREIRPPERYSACSEMVAYALLVAETVEYDEPSSYAEAVLSN